MIRDVILYPDRRLETPCDPITEFDTSGLHQLAADLFETMYFHEGLGLDAPQIGVMRRVAVIDPSSGRDKGQKIALINPGITEAQGTQYSEEGCLSFPDFVERITRSMSVIMDASDSTYGEEYLKYRERTGKWLPLIIGKVEYRGPRK